MGWLSGTGEGYDASMTLQDVLNGTCLACLASPCKVGRVRQISTDKGILNYVECKACTKKYKRAEKLSHIKDSPERQAWFGYVPLIRANLDRLTQEFDNESFK